MDNQAKQQFEDYDNKFFSSNKSDLEKLIICRNKLAKIDKSVWETYDTEIKEIVESVIKETFQKASNLSEALGWIRSNLSELAVSIEYEKLINSTYAKCKKERFG